MSVRPTQLTQVFYSDDGSTAIEVAIKMALHYWVHRGQPSDGGSWRLLTLGLRGPEKKAKSDKPTQAVAFSSSSQIKVQANADWADTRIMLRKGDTVNFAASGTYQYERNVRFVCGPGGFSGGTGRTPPCPKLTPCALIGRIGFTEPFEVGNEMQVVAKEMGQLYLRVNEQPVADNSGTIEVEIVVIPAAK